MTDKYIWGTLHFYKSCVNIRFIFKVNQDFLIKQLTGIFYINFFLNGLWQLFILADNYRFPDNRVIRIAEVTRNIAMNMEVIIHSACCPKYPAAFRTEYKIIERPTILSFLPMFLLINKRIPLIRQTRAMSSSEKTWNVISISPSV